jgi:3-hydroxymyristoyl/3-hydroxydecanoyl-(acyl carrier protein) dehydratase
VIAVRDLGIQLKPEPGTEYAPGPGGTVAAFLGRRNKAGEPAMLNEFHMAHAAKGDLAVAMGPEFAVYRDIRAPYIPNGDFLFVDRVMRLDGERGRLEPGAVMVTEYDSPPEAWYYRENAYPGMPNCVYMETSLQAAILLGYYLGATLPTPDTELSIRNLEGRATVTADVDLRGRTIRQESTLRTHTTGAGGVLQSFTYTLTADGEPFYEGESLYGYFTEEALASQAGLDGGQATVPWLDRQDDPPPARRIDLRGNEFGRRRGHLAIVDWVDVVDEPEEGVVAYLRGHRKIRPDDWYFDCHFHRDPVMPGSLGVEAMIQAVQAYVIDAGLVDRPRFAMPVGVPMAWKYRGQILRDDPEMDFEVRVKEIRREDGRMLVVGDASLWKPGLRIYEVTDLAVHVTEGSR